jgi:hypothetical protein|nr:hypothetical protein Q903MT_gene1454 [Picea sitchensis]
MTGWAGHNLSGIGERLTGVESFIWMLAKAIGSLQNPHLLTQDPLTEQEGVWLSQDYAIFR